MAFLSLIDDRMKPKGSRDPLGFELIWSKLGRNIIGNLTTITGSSENFATALLGFYWANEMVDEPNNDERAVKVRDLFLRFEQIAAYMRKEQGSETVMGVNRVSKRLGEGSLNHFVLGNAPDAQILSNQVSYGLWGLYSSAMRDTGLVNGEVRVPTEAGKSIAKAIETLLDRELFLGLIGKTVINRSEIEDNAPALMAAITSEEVQKILLEALLEGSSDENACFQKELWEKTRQLMHKGLFSGEQKVTVELFIDSIKGEDISPRLKKSLTEIEAVERLLVTMNNIFHYCRSQSGARVEKVVEDIDKQGYDFSSLSYDLDGVDLPRKEATLKPIEHLKVGDYSEGIDAIFSLNKLVMTDRGGAAWVTAPDGVLDVVVKAEAIDLIPSEKIQGIWDYDYFIGSYLRMAQNYAAKYVNV